MKRLRSLFRTRRESDLDQEIEAHLAMAIRDRVERGETPHEAQAAALREFGNRLLVAEVTREVWGWAPVERLWQDVHYAFRTMRRSPGFTLVVLLSLALGIGANTAIFSLVHLVMLRPLPVSEPEQLVELLSRYPGEPRVNGFDWKIYEFFRDHNHVFSNLTAVAAARLETGAAGLDPEAVDAEYVAGNFFPMLGVRPAAGRLIGPQDDTLGSPDAAVAVLSWAYWKSRFQLDPAVQGRRIVVNQRTLTVIGVAPRSFTGLQPGARPSLWLPVAAEAIMAKTSARANGRLGVRLAGRLKSGVSIEEARAEMSVLDRHRVQELVRTSKDPLIGQLKIEVEPAGTGFSAVRDFFGKPLLVLMTLVGLLLLLACTNIASLLLARGAARQREIALRVSLGASRFRLVRQVLTECLLLSFAGAVIGTLLAYAGTDILARVIASGRAGPGLPPHIDLRVEPDAYVLFFTAGLAVLSGLVFGAGPLLSVLRSVPAPVLRETGRAAVTRWQQLFGQSLVISQVAFSLVLLMFAGLFVLHLWKLKNDNSGFQRDRVLLMKLDPVRGGYGREQLSRPYQELLARLGAIPGVRSATLAAVTPISGAGASGFLNVEGFQERPGQRRYVNLNWVAPRYFETLGTSLVAGRDFRFDDEGRPPVAIVNQAMVQYYFGGRNPLGRHFRIDGDANQYEIVGVASDAKYLDLREAAPRTVYLNAFQQGRVYSDFALRTHGAPEGVAHDARQVVREVLRTVPVAKVTTLADQIDASIVPERVLAMLAGLFGALGAALAIIGLYGLLAYTVARRVPEIGVRIALGATQGDVTRMILKSAAGLVLTGVVIGAPVALSAKTLAGHWIENLPVISPLPIAFAVATLIASGLTAAYLPARRAASVDPVDALRHE